MIEMIKHGKQDSVFERRIEMKFTVYIEEHISRAFEVEAEDIGKAMQSAEDKYRSGEFVLDDANVTARLMMAENDYEATEWEEF